MADPFALLLKQTNGHESEGLPKTFNRVGIIKMKNQMKKLMMLCFLFLSVNMGSQLNAQSGCDESCIDWYLVITDSQGQTLSETFLYTTCDGNQTISACEFSGSEARIILNQNQASCEETWQLQVVMSHEDQAYCGASVKAMGRVTPTGSGNWKASAYLDKDIGAQIIAGICETAFYAIEDRSFVASTNEPNVAVNFIADIGFGVNITFGGGQIIQGEGLIWFDLDHVYAFKDAVFSNPLCW